SRGGVVVGRQHGPFMALGLPLLQVMGAYLRPRCGRLGIRPRGGRLGRRALRIGSTVHGLLRHRCPLLGGSGRILVAGTVPGFRLTFTSLPSRRKKGKSPVEWISSHLYPSRLTS